MTDQVTVEMARTTIIALVALLRQAKPTLIALDVAPEEAQPVAVQLEQVINGLVMKACTLSEEQRKAEEARESLHELKQRQRYINNVDSDPALLMSDFAWALNDSDLFRGLASACVVRLSDDPGLDVPTLCFVDAQGEPLVERGEDDADNHLKRQLAKLRNMLDADAQLRIAAADQSRDRKLNSAMVKLEKSEVGRLHLEDRLKAAQESRDRAVAQVEDLQADNNTLIDRLNTSRGVNSNLEADILRKMQDNDLLKLDNERLKSANTKLNDKLEEAQKSERFVKSITRTNEELVKENQALRLKADEANRLLHAAENKADAMLQELNEMKAGDQDERQRAHEETSGVIQEYSDRLIAVEKDRDFARRELTAANADLDRYRERCERLQAEKVVVHQDCPFTTTSAEDVSIFRERQAKKMAEASSAEAESKELATEVKALRGNIKELTQELRRVESDREFVQRELRDSSADLEELQAENDRLKLENTALRDDAASAGKTTASALGLLDACSEQPVDRYGHALNASLVHKQIGGLLLAFAAAEDLHAAQVYRLAQHVGDERWREMEPDKMINLAIDSAQRARTLADRSNDRALATGEIKRRLGDAANYLAFALARWSTMRGE